MKHNEIYNLQQNLSKKNIIFCFLGLITQPILEEIGLSLREKMILNNANEDDVNKVFTILIEQAQNMIKYFNDNKKVEQTEIVIVGKNSTGFFIESGNTISLTERKTLEEHLNKISLLNKDELKKLYKDKISEATSNPKRAGLGFIEMARKASKPLEFDFSRTLIKEELFFSIKVTI